jgi:hypothetical protein
MKFKYLLGATGGGLGGGWNSELGFRELARGFSVWISDEERFTRLIRSSRPLNWRTACQEMLSFETGWIGCDCSGLKDVHTQGISGWQSELLVLSSVNQEELGFEDVVKTLVQLDEEDLEVISRHIGTFYNQDTLMALRDIFELYPGNPLKIWELLGGVPDKFSLSALSERIEEEREALEDIAGYFDLEISTLLSKFFDKKPTTVRYKRNYHDQRDSVKIKILQFVQRTGRLPTVAELAEH